MHFKSVFLLFTLFAITTVLCNTVQNRSPRIFGLSWLFGGGGYGGVGGVPVCNGCPPHFCNDDPAIIHGYCCGCRRSEVLPIICPPFLQCPIDGISVCNDYNYMLSCCC